MKKIILCPNPGRDRGFKLTKQVYDMLTEAGCEPVMCMFPGSRWYDKPQNMTTAKLRDALNYADMVVSFGGDGTLMRIARETASFDVPILGVNLGNKGFMVELERDQTDLILKAAGGEYMIERRMMLDVAVERGGRTVHSDFALNDIVVNGVGRILNLTVFGDGKRISAFSGDGVVVSSPTGSTAYSLSAGGPIVEPAAENIIVTPICAHILVAKSFVLAPDRRVTVKVGDIGTRQAYMTADGGVSVNLTSGDIISVSRSKYVTKLISVSGRSFYERVSEKLGERL